MKMTKNYISEQVFNSSMLRVGEMMEVYPGGEVLLMTYSGLVDLNNVKNTYTYETRDKMPSFPGRKLTKGESVTLTQD